MRKQLKRLWKWSWVATFPLCAFFIFWVWTTLHQYYTFNVRYDPNPTDFSLVQTAKVELSSTLRHVRHALAAPFTGRRYQDSEMTNINLFVTESNVAQLDANLPHSGFTYVEGGLWDGEKIRKIKIRYRGDYPKHWAYRKKSLRVKTRKKFLFRGMRQFNLTVPKAGIFNNFMSYRLAKHMGLVTPEVEMVNVTINGQPKGVHVFIQQLDESMLRQNRLMPGDLYAGEFLAKDRYVGTTNDLFRHPGLWEKRSYNNHYPESSYQPLKKLLRLIQGPMNEAQLEEISQLLDIEAWGKFCAFLTLAQAYHYDIHHNWRLYFDPARSRFIPVVWDSMGWIQLMGKSSLKLDLDKMTFVPLLFHLFRNGDFIRARQKAIEGFFLSGKVEAYMTEVDHTLAVTTPFLKIDPDITREALQLSQQFKSVIAYTFRTVKNNYISTAPSVRYTRLETQEGIAFQISGRRTVDKILLKYLRPMVSLKSVRIRFKVNNRWVTQAISATIANSGSQIEVHPGLIPRFLVKDGRPRISFFPQPAYYELIIDGVKQNNRLLEVLVDHGTGRFEPAMEADQLEKHSFPQMIRVVRDQPPAKPLIWQGQVSIEGVRRIDDDLVIFPGTDIRLGPGAGLIIKRRLLAEGQPHRPIRFLAAENGQDPWGAVVLIGPNANGSRLAHCEFIDGSGLKGDLFEYSAMLSVHDVKAVSVEHCRFSKNRLVDDMVHAVYADIHFKGCEFSGALSDALDLDICQATVENCRFKNSGNDGLDLMDTHALVLDTLLDGNGDKGISVGEGSRLIVINSIMADNKIGLQSKDGSRAVVYNVDFQANALAIDAYKKNWRYDRGGTVFIYKSKLEDNEKMITADKRSAIWIYDSYVDRMINGNKRITVHDTVDSAHIDRSVVKEFWRFPEEKVTSTVLGRDAIKEMDANRRGANQVGG